MDWEGDLSIRANSRRTGMAVERVAERDADCISRHVLATAPDWQSPASFRRQGKHRAQPE